MLWLFAPLLLSADLDGDGREERLEWHHHPGERRGADRSFLRLPRPQGDLISPVYRAFQAGLADLDEDGRVEIILGVWSQVPRHAEPEPHRAVWVLGLRAEGFRELWRGSALANSLEAFQLWRNPQAVWLLSLERSAGLCISRIYRWTGFGFAAKARRRGCRSFAPCPPGFEAPCLREEGLLKQPLFEGGRLEFQPLGTD